MSVIYVPSGNAWHSFQTSTLGIIPSSLNFNPWCTSFPAQCVTDYDRPDGVAPGH